jgi:hypothetical protein
MGYSSVYYATYESDGKLHAAFYRGVGFGIPAFIKAVRVRYEDACVVVLSWKKLDGEDFDANDGTREILTRLNDGQVIHIRS